MILMCNQRQTTALQVLLHFCLPAIVGFKVSVAIGQVGLNHCQTLQRCKGFVVVLIESATHTGTLGSTYGAIGLKQLNGCATR